jgi:phospholipid/cholesterol/gamma-HCH transport system substrate-binding protein
MKNTLETRLGFFVLLAVISAFILLETVGGLDVFKHVYTLKARFNTVRDLKVGDPVKMAGVPIGRVEKLAISPDTGKVEVTLRLNHDTPVHTDSKATVKAEGLLGVDFVDIEFGSAASPLLAQDAQIATAEQPDLNALLARLDDAAAGVQNLTKSFTGDKIDNLLGPFTDFLRQNNAHLSSIISNVNNVTGQVASGQGTVGKLIYDQTLYDKATVVVTNLQDASAEIKGTVAQARNIIDQVNAGQGTVGKLIKDPKLYTEATATVGTLHEIFNKINNGQGSVGKLVNDQEFYKDAKLSLQKLDKATESLEDTGPLSILGSLATTLF